MEGIPRSIRFYPDIYASLVKELERRRSNGDKEIDFTKLVNELCLIMPVDAWGDLINRLANLEQEVKEIKSRLEMAKLDK
jgi:hypothetical protein